MTAAAVRLERVDRVFGGKRVLDGLELQVTQHERVGIVGRSGAGKSTLLSLIAGLDVPDGGVITVGGESEPGGGWPAVP